MTIKKKVKVGAVIVVILAIVVIAAVVLIKGGVTTAEIKKITVKGDQNLETVNERGDVIQLVVDGSFNQVTIE